jgi:O-antigen/teichoic acid export membrane protein
MSRLRGNIVYNIAGQALLLALSFVAVRFVFRQLGADSLGIIYFILALNVILTATLGMGICETTVREISAHFNSEPDYIRELLRTASLCYWGAYVILSVIIYFAAPIIVEKWIHLKSLDAAAAIQALRILGIASFLALPRSFYTSMLRGVERMEYTNIIDVAVSALQQFGTIGIMLAGGNLLNVIWFMAGCFVAGILAYMIICFRFFSWKALLPGFSSTVIRRNVVFTSHVALISILAMIYTQADKVIISKFLPIGIFGLYTVAYGAMSRSNMITAAVSQAAFPQFSALFKTQERGKLVSKYQKLQDLVCFGTIPLFAAVPFMAIPLFSYLFDVKSAQMLLLPVTFLSVGFYMNGTLSVPYLFSLAVGRPDIVARFNFYSLFVVLPTTALLIYFGGLKGAGFSWVFYHVLAYAYVIPRIYSECLRVPVWRWYAQMLSILGISGITYGTGWIALRVMSEGSGLYAAAAYCAASIVFLGASFLLIGEELRSLFEQHPIFRQLRSWAMPS